jgi:hypothetical protein
MVSSSAEWRHTTVVVCLLQPSFCTHQHYQWTCQEPGTPTAPHYPTLDASYNTWMHADAGCPQHNNTLACSAQHSRTPTYTRHRRARLGLTTVHGNADLGDSPSPAAGGSPVPSRPRWAQVVRPAANKPHITAKHTQERLLQQYTRVPAGSSSSSSDSWAVLVKCHLPKCASCQRDPKSGEAAPNTCVVELPTCMGQRPRGHEAA